MKPLALAAVSLLAGCAAPPSVTPRTTPRVDYHQHLVSARFARITHLPERDAAAMLRDLDAAGIERAIVLSTAYSQSDDRRTLLDAEQRIREENDWTSAQVAPHAARLIGVCSDNPLRDGAIEELERCLGLPGMTGIKLHLGNSGVTLRDTAHAARVRRFFALAQRHRVPLFVHLRPRRGVDYGAEDARVFLDQLVTAAPDVEIVVAHLSQAGRYTQELDGAMAAFGEAAERRDPRMNRVYFDISGVDMLSPDQAALVARRIRQIGTRHTLYATDLIEPGRGSTAQFWERFRAIVPLSAAELGQIASSSPRFMRRP